MKTGVPELLTDRVFTRTFYKIPVLPFLNKDCI